MAYGRNDMMRVKHMDPDSLSFSMLTSDDVRRLAVMKVVTPLTLNNLGHPIDGGLYDLSLGCSGDRKDVCRTCYKSADVCTGHFGYIELPVLAVNPVFHKIIGTVLKIVCFECYHLQFSNEMKYCLSIQMKLLYRGLVTEANEVEVKIQDIIAQNSSLESLAEDEMASLKQYETLASSDASEKVIINKNIEATRNNFVSSLLRYLRTPKQCRHCRRPWSKVTAVKNRIRLEVDALDDHDGPNKRSLKRVVRREYKYVNPQESRGFLRKLWVNESNFLQELVPVLKDVKLHFPTDVFYMDCVLVLPPSVRPINMLHGKLIEHEQTTLYRQILQTAMLVRLIVTVVQNDDDVDAIPAESKEMYTLAPGRSPIEKLNEAWETLQQNVDDLIDKDTRKHAGEGLKQVIEKKEGVIRQHMMGKRVNFSARSVITPDPNLNIDEIGIPEEFAKRLTYPVPVTSWNVAELRKMIMNGPNVHPGAIQVEYENGSVVRIKPGDNSQQLTIIKRLLTPDDKEKGFTGVKRVYRHLCNGDILLLNRQPTLHKPSIMAHTARILRGEKTLRLHYANCKAYNADFDGDEMNAHFPQNELARSEGYTLANVSNQYLVPKDGTPLSGLIQDHVISGVKLSIRGRFFPKDDYHQLVFQALANKMSAIKLLPPAIVKPLALWSGKQVLSTVILNIIPNGQNPINLSSSAKIKEQAWNVRPPRAWKAGGAPFQDAKTMTEAEVIIRSGELLVGVLDKTHYGATPYGLVHCMYELYGGVYATKLLSAFAKLFTYFLQWEGFTLGVHDILVRDGADRKRRKIIEGCRAIGRQVVAKALDVPRDAPLDEIVERMDDACFRNAKMRTLIDREYKDALDPYTNGINKTCLPAGLLCKFPHNNLQLMVQSGAKGSAVNTMQISCLLGQIELEGKRPPVMISGKSLPSFPIFEFAPRAGGFVDGRFMTGIRPQEFFFHCMAGREGLIDTAVKTSRSGYLQRCLIKHLEGLTVNYDLTVRDSDKSVIQFLYGEDGMDVMKSQFLNAKQMAFLNDNVKAIVDKKTVSALRKDEEQSGLADHLAKTQTWTSKEGSALKKQRRSPFVAFSRYTRKKVQCDSPKKLKNGRARLTRKLIDLWRSAGDDIKDSFKKRCQRCPDPLNAEFQPYVHYGSLSDRLLSTMEDFKGTTGKKSRRQFENMLKYKAMTSLCDPGEPVGLIAAQSIGEPSTQMTLNTFHFAGRGEMNVTLGIPRLREILMMASKHIKTPSMEIPFLDVPDLAAEAEKLRRALTRVTVDNVLRQIDVEGHLEENLYREMVYTLRFRFLPHHLYKSKYNVRPKQVLRHMTTVFFKQLFNTLRKYTRLSTNVVAVDRGAEQSSRRAPNGSDSDGDTEEAPKRAEADGSDESDVEDEEDAKLTSKFEKAHDMQEPEEDDEKKEASDNEIEGGAANSKTESDDEDEDSTAVVKTYNQAQNYSYDKKERLWCELTFSLPLTQKKLDLSAVLKEVAGKSVISETPNIKRAITYDNDGRTMLRTEGINIIEMFKFSRLLDLDKLYTNDVHQMADKYGIEAAGKVIVKEVKEVFKVYGIAVDPHHLLLVADYMTFNGSFEPLNRAGMHNSASPLQQMSFEASLNFLKAATLQGKQDQLQSPSSCLMVGKPCQTGTGCFSLMHLVK